MLLSIFRYIKGYLKIRVVGYSPERFLNACSHRGIYIWGITPVRGSYDMYITVPGFRKLKPVIRKTGAKVVITDRIGLPFFFFQYRKRKVFFAGAVLGIALIYFLSLFVWNIDVRGNRKYTDEALIAFLKEQGVEHGMRLSQVDCDRIVKDIRKSYDEIIWVSASIEGCRLIIQIKENEDSVDTADKSGETAGQGAPDTDGDAAGQGAADTVGVAAGQGAADTAGVAAGQDAADTVENAAGQGMDIVADFDGVITTMIVRQGIPCVAEGQEVKKGDILVTGAVPVIDDAGETTGYQFHQSEADIRAKVSMDYQDSCEISYEWKEYIHQEKEDFYLQIGKHILWLGSRENPFPKAEELTMQSRLRIGKYFYLPVSWGKRVTSPYSSTEVKYSEDQIRENLTARYRRFTDNLVKKGVEIIENDVKIYTGSAKAEAKGTLTVITDIGTERPTSIVEDVIDGDD